MKLAIVINGGGGAGKDTLCDFAAKKFKTVNVSSIDPIKKIAGENGWQGEKTPEARRFLSELKRVFTEYNDLPTNYILKKYEDFLSDDSELFFVHIREGEQIAHFIEKARQIGGQPISLLVRTQRCSENYGNASDDDVEKYDYDFVFYNDKPLDVIVPEFIEFISKNIFNK